MKITKTFVDRTKPPEAGQDLYRDSELKGFGLRVTSGAKAFFVEKRVNGRVKRMTVGRYPELTVEEARKEAQKLLGKIATGIDPVAEKKESRSKSIPLSQAFADYVKARKSLKPSTIADYQQALKEVTPDWLNKPLLSINKDMIVRRHTKHGETRSKARANLAMRILRAIFNFAAGEYEDAKGRSLIPENPVKRLSHTRAWYNIKHRQNVIKAHELAPWYRGIQQLTHRHDDKQAELMKDYFLLILFTGLRRNEGATLKWRDIDFKDKTLTIPDPKNRERHVLPLSDFLHDLLARRKVIAINDYVFPANSKTGYINDPRKAMRKVIETSGIEFTLHDLRRTFITIAESLDIPVYALKRLLNHKMQNDITAGYVVMDVERLRKPMQMITDYLLSCMELKKTDNVLTMETRKHTYEA